MDRRCGARRTDFRITRTSEYRESFFPLRVLMCPVAAALTAADECVHMNPVPQVFVAADRAKLIGFSCRRDATHAARASITEEKVINPDTGRSGRCRGMCARFT